MGKNKIKPPVNYDFESTNQQYNFTKVCKDMQYSKAWEELNLRQHRLIFTLEIKIYSK